MMGLLCFWLYIEHCHVQHADKKFEIYLCYVQGMEVICVNFIIVIGIFIN
jgi:hypothetical protein